MSEITYRRRYYNNVYIGVVFMALAIVVPFAKGANLDKSIISIASGLVGGSDGRPEPNSAAEIY
jgi:hypothetical protein